MKWITIPEYSRKYGVTQKAVAGRYRAGRIAFRRRPDGAGPDDLFEGRPWGRSLCMVEDALPVKRGSRSKSSDVGMSPPHPADVVANNSIRAIRERLKDPDLEDRERRIQAHATRVALLAIDEPALRGDGKSWVHDDA